MTDFGARPNSTAIAAATYAPTLELCASRGSGLLRLHLRTAPNARHDAHQMNASSRAWPSTASRNSVTAALAARKDASKCLRSISGSIPKPWTSPCLCASRQPRWLRPSDHPGRRRTDRHLRLHGFRHRRGTRHLRRLTELHQSSGPQGDLARECISMFDFNRSRYGSRLCCAPIPRRCRSGRCWRAAARTASSSPAAPIAATATRPTRRCFTKSRGWSSTGPTSVTCNWILQELRQGVLRGLRPGQDAFVIHSFRSLSPCSRSMSSAGATRARSGRGRAGGLAGDSRPRDDPSQCDAQLRPRPRRDQGIAGGWASSNRHVEIRDARFVRSSRPTCAGSAT